MHQPLVLICLFILGIVAQNVSFISKDFYRKINRFILYISLPAITLAKIPQIKITTSVIFPISSAWLIFFGCIIFTFILGKIYNWSKATMGCIILCCGLGNTSFVGYPFLHYFYGEQSIQYAIFVDQPGSFLILSTFGVFIAAYMSSATVQWNTLLKKIVQFPPFVVFIIALFIPNYWITVNAQSILNFIGGFMIPLALFSLGLQFKMKIQDIEWKKFTAGILYKLMLAPLIIYICLLLFVKQKMMLHTISIIECAMPPMITSSLLATEYKLDEKLAGLFPTLGIVLSTATLLFWKWLLN